MMITSSDDESDSEVLEWNAAVESGDPERIEAVKAKVLNAIHTRIMNEDLNYQKAGWK